MNPMKSTVTSLLSFLVLCSVSCTNNLSAGSNQHEELPFSPIDTSGNTIANRFVAPPEFTRVAVDSTSFGFYLRNLPLKTHGSSVYLYNGQLKGNQLAQAAVIDISVGKRDLQQCADAVMRLRAEYLFSQKRFDEIHFHFVNGFNCTYSKWRAGNRISVQGNKVSWVQSGSVDYSYAGFMKYMETVFNYASTLSLEKELVSVNLKEVQIGDVLIRGGSPGHAVIVVDMVENKAGKKLVLLAQSYMPAQDIHVLKNPMNKELSPWFDLEQMEKVYTPEWTFEANVLKRFL